MASGFVDLRQRFEPARGKQGESGDGLAEAEPSRLDLRIADISLSTGAGFLVVISGAMMLMPGVRKLSRTPAIDVDEQVAITGML